MGKTLREIFREFDDRERSVRFTGDVKYHLGHRTVWTTSTGHAIDLYADLQSQPHSELVNPVAVGRVRAIQDRSGDAGAHPRARVVLIHGDAAFAGEGVVQETLNLSELEAYTVGGTNPRRRKQSNPASPRIRPKAAPAPTPPTSRRCCADANLSRQRRRPRKRSPQVVRLSLDFREMFQRDRHHRHVLLPFGVVTTKPTKRRLRSP